MKETSIARKIRLTDLHLASWKKLHGLMAHGANKEKPPILPQHEHDFTEVRSDLLQEHAYIYNELELTSEYTTKTMNVLNRAVSIQGVRNLPPEEIRRLQTEWNAVFTKLEVLLGQLKLKRNEMARQGAVALYFERTPKTLALSMAGALMLALVASYFYFFH